MPVEAKTTKAVFLAALEQATPAERAAYLDATCAGDAALRRRVEAMLRVHDQPDPLLDHPAGGPHAGDAPGPAGLGFLDPPRRDGSLGRLGHYEVLEVVGRGGMGIVLRAFDEKLHRVVAVKVLSPALADTGAARQRFVREARAAAAVAHENVIGIHAVEDAGPVPYLVMQYIQGKTLQDKLDRGGPLPLPDILRIGLQVAEGLAAAHRQGLVHRDIKPANILLENGVERVRITDFGLARAADDASLTRSGVVAGTPQYMSPEQAEGGPVDPRSDLFSLGSVLYAMSAGRPPFRAETPLAVLRRVCDDTPRPLRTVNPAVPPWLEQIVARLQAKTPADRFTAAEVAALLGRCLAQLQAGVEPSGVVPKAEPSRVLLARASRRSLLLWGIPAVLLAAAAGGVGYLVRTRTDDPSGRTPSTEPGPTGPVTLKPARTLTGHTNEVLAVAVSPDGKVIASGGKDRTILLWDADAWQAREPLTGAEGEIGGLAVSPDGLTLASVCSTADSCGIRLWEVKTGKPKGTLGGPGPGMWGLAWSPDGTRVACAGFDRTVRVWEVAAGGEPCLKVENVCPRFVRGMAFSPNGDLIVTGGNGATHLWDARTGREIPSAFPGDMCPTFFPVGEPVVAGWTHGAGRVTVCDVPSGKVRAVWRAHPGVIEGLAVSPDARFIATVGVADAGKDGVARVWAVADQTEVATLTGHRGVVYAAAFSADGGTLVTTGRDDFTVRVWDLPADCRVRK